MRILRPAINGLILYISVDGKVEDIGKIVFGHNQSPSFFFHHQWLDGGFANKTFSLLTLHFSVIQHQMHKYLSKYDCNQYMPTLCSLYCYKVSFQKERNNIPVLLSIHLDWPLSNILVVHLRIECIFTRFALNYGNTPVVYPITETLNYP